MIIYNSMIIWVAVIGIIYNFIHPEHRIEQRDSDNPAIRKVRFSTSLDQYEKQFADLIYDSISTEFGRLAL